MIPCSTYTHHMLPFHFPSSLDIDVQFEEESYQTDEDDPVFQICSEVVRGSLQRDVRLLIQNVTTDDVMFRGNNTVVVQLKRTH